MWIFSTVCRLIKDASFQAIGRWPTLGIFGLRNWNGIPSDKCARSHKFLKTKTLKILTVNRMKNISMMCQSLPMIQAVSKSTAVALLNDVDILNMRNGEFIFARVSWWFDSFAATTKLMTFCGASSILQMSTNRFLIKFWAWVLLDTLMPFKVWAKHSA